jgi:hypothetical protein
MSQPPETYICVRRHRENTGRGPLARRGPANLGVGSVAGCEEVTTSSIKRRGVGFNPNRAKNA